LKVELRYLDKNRNQFVIKDEILEYRPIKKIDSSSGDYDGGRYQFFKISDSSISTLKNLIESFENLSEDAINTKGTSVISFSGKRFYLKFGSRVQTDIFNFFQHLLAEENIQLEHDEYVASQHEKEIEVLLDGISDQENIGMAFRVADTFGVNKLMIANSNFRLIDKKTERISRQTTKHIEFQYIDDPVKELQSLEEENYLIAAIELTTKSVEISSFYFSRFDKILLILGSEQRGISKAILNKVNVTVHLPMFGKNSSMNVIQAMGLGLSEITDVTKSSQHDF